MLSGIKTLEEGVRVSEENEFLGSREVLDLIRQPLLGLEEIELGRAHTALVRS